MTIDLSKSQLFCGVSTRALLLAFIAHLFIFAGFVFTDFDKLWMSEKPNIMQFNEIRDKYEKQLLARLKTSNVSLSLDAKASNLVLQEC